MTKSWSTKKLGEICTVDWGNTSLTKSSYVEGGEFLAVSAAGCDGRIGHKEHARHTPVLSAIGAQCGRMFLPEEDFTAIKNTITLTPRNGTCTGKFLYLLLTHVDLPKRGAAQPFISKGDIQTFEVTIPPLPDQQRIVAKLDEAFAGIAKAKENAEKNVANAREIFESELNAIFSKKEAGWNKTKMGSVVDLLTGFAFKSRGYTSSDDGVPLLRGDNIIQGAFRWDNVKKWPKEDTITYDKFHLEENDIVLAMDRTWVKSGIKYAQISKNDLPCLLLQRVARLRAREKLEHSFLKNIIGSPLFKRYVLSIQTGLGVPHISGKQIENFEFNLPPLNIQKEIAAKLTKLDKNTRDLKAKYEHKLLEIDSLKQSLLHHAFTGQL